MLSNASLSTSEKQCPARQDSVSSKTWLRILPSCRPESLLTSGLATSPAPLRFIYIKQFSS